MNTVKGNHGKVSLDWFGDSAPTTLNVGTAATWVGSLFEFASNGRIAGLRAYRLAAYQDAPVGVILDQNGNMHRGITWQDVNPAGDGWHQAWIRPWLRIDTSLTYRIWVLFPTGHYSRTNNRFTSGPVTINGITRTGSMQSTSLAPWIPAPSTNLNANGIDVLWQAD